MDIKYTNEENSTVENVEYTENNDAYIQKKRFRTVDILIFITCFLVSLIFWCYANYIEDPIIQKEVTVDFVLVNGDGSEDIIPDKINIWIYGEESVLMSITNNTITIHVDRDNFENQDTINYELDYPEEIHSHKSHHTLTLTNSDE